MNGKEDILMCLAYLKKLQPNWLHLTLTKSLMSTTVTFCYCC